MKNTRPYGQLPGRPLTPGGKTGKGGAGRAPAAKGKADKKRKPPKGSAGSRVALAALTCANLGLTVAIHVLRRQDIIHAVRDSDKVKLLLTREKETRS